MNKILLPFLALFLAACASPQVIVTPFAEVTVTSPPPIATAIPTPTLHPQFVELQDKVAVSGEQGRVRGGGVAYGMGCAAKNPHSKGVAEISIVGSPTCGLTASPPGQACSPSTMLYSSMAEFCAHGA